MIRDEFEKLFPVPEGVEWNTDRQLYTYLPWKDSYEGRAYNAIWLGFQAGHALKCEEERKAGHAAGLEDARSEYARTHVTVRVPAHSDSTEQ